MIEQQIKDKIINMMECELDERDYECSYGALVKIIDTWETRKENLLNLLSKHPLWNPEKLMIQFDFDYERRINTNNIEKFSRWLQEKLHAYFDYTKYNNQSKEYEVCNFISGINEQFFNNSMKDKIDFINSLNENYKLRTNMKASKAIGKICKEEGWDKLDGFNRMYAEFCDCLNPIKVKRHTCISLNPLDFLLMSNGNSWSSCHDIDCCYDEPGCYSSGTISYMLDKHSFVFYTVDSSYDGDKIELYPKIQRQMFGYNDEVLAQLRLYPQNNDSGSSAIYNDIRQIVQKVIADCLDKPNLWIKSNNDVRSIVSRGLGATCYPDWQSGNPGSKHCSISTLKSREQEKENRKIVFGAKPICISCGETHNHTEKISCCQGLHYCSDCGCIIFNEDDVYWINGNAYCEDCVTYCEDCKEYVLNEDATEIDGLYVCDRCVEHGDYYRCSECGELHYIDCLSFLDDDSCYCQDCYTRYVRDCFSCDGSFHKNDLIYDEETDEYYCEDCYADLLEERQAELQESEEQNNNDCKEDGNMNIELLLNEIKNILGNDIKVEVNNVQKNNVTLTGIYIKEESQNATPIFYAEYCEELFQEQGYKAVAQEIVNAYKKTKRLLLDPKEFMTLDYIKDNLLLCIAPSETNKGVVTIPYLDLELYFRVQLTIDSEEQGTFKITESILKTLDVSKETLLNIALRQQGYKETSMFDVIIEQYEKAGVVMSEDMKQIIKGNTQEPLQIILRNKYEMYGASVMYDKERLLELANRLDSDLYILPSSIHEVIVVPVATCEMDTNELNEMISSINNTEVKPEEVLSTHAYTFRRNTKDIIW